MLESMNADSRWEIVGFSDARASEGQVVSGYPVMSEDALLNFPEPVDAVISVGSPAAREKIFEKLRRNPNVSFPPVVHPSSIVARGVELPGGVLITGFCSVSPDTAIGKGVFLNGHCVVVQGLNIGDDAELCAGSVIVRNVIESAKMMGNPARAIA
jgi:UDP-3-O-[3-hydroxymyristoyl] glucosamine N-acyltransferase